MHQDNQSPEDRIPKPWQPRYGLGGLLLFMLVCSVMAASVYYYVQSLEGRREFQTAFILFTLVAPLCLMVVLSLMRALWTWRRKR